MNRVTGLGASPSPGPAPGERSAALGALADSYANLNGSNDNTTAPESRQPPCNRNGRAGVGLELRFNFIHLLHLSGTLYQSAAKMYVHIMAHAPVQGGVLTMPMSVNVAKHEGRGWWC